MTTCAHMRTCTHSRERLSSCFPSTLINIAIQWGLPFTPFSNPYCTPIVPCGWETPFVARSPGSPWRGNMNLQWLGNFQVGIYLHGFTPIIFETQNVIPSRKLLITFGKSPKSLWEHSLSMTMWAMSVITRGYIPLLPPLTHHSTSIFPWFS